MLKLIEYTGGSFILTIILLIIALFSFVISFISLFVQLKNNKDILKNKKIEFTIMIISIIVLVLFIGGITGYYIGVYMMLWWTNKLKSM